MLLVERCNAGGRSKPPSKLSLSWKSTAWCKSTRRIPPTSWRTDPTGAAGGSIAGGAAVSAAGAAAGPFPEVRITQQGKPRNYISYAENWLSRRLVRFYLLLLPCLLLAKNRLPIVPLVFDQSDGSTTIVLKAMGRAIKKAVTIAEILKRKIPLYQLNALSSVEMVDIDEPVEEGLDVVTSRRFVSCMKSTLSLSPDGLDSADPGYQPPLSAEEISSGDLPAATIQQQQPPLQQQPQRQLAMQQQH